MLAADAALVANREDWFASEVLHHMKRALKRLDLTARSLIAVIDQGSCSRARCSSSALAADRTYMLDVDGGPEISTQRAQPRRAPDVERPLAPATRFLADRSQADALETGERMTAADALDAGLVTFAPGRHRLGGPRCASAVEERASLSPDALTGMEANLRFAGPETMETKIFGRLSAWQNWIFQRPNAVGERGAAHAATASPSAPSFNWSRT